jgi:hypothetical protein
MDVSAQTFRMLNRHVTSYRAIRGMELKALNGVEASSI